MRGDDKPVAQQIDELNSLRQVNAALEQQVRERSAHLNAADEELEAFCHVIAHDLRAPLQLIIGYANLLNADDMEPELVIYLQAIRANAQRLNDMLSRLLAFTNQQQPEGETVTQVDARLAVDAALARAHVRLDEQHITVDVAPDLPPVLGYASRIEEVFVYLIDNAIKYIGTHNPEPRLTISGVREASGVSRYLIQDNGRGMVPEEQRRLSKLLGQPRITQTRGLSLELFIAHHVVTRLNGTMGVESTQGVGCTFWFRLPTA